MEIGLITDGLGRLPLPEVLDIVAAAGLTCVEVATGNWSDAPHVDLATLAGSAGAREEFLGSITGRGLTLSALNANGNQLHPVDGPRQDRQSRTATGSAPAHPLVERPVQSTPPRAV